MPDREPDYEILSGGGDIAKLSAEEADGADQVVADLLDGLKTGRAVNEVRSTYCVTVRGDGWTHLLPRLQLTDAEAVVFRNWEEDLKNSTESRLTIREAKKEGDSGD